MAWKKHFLSAAILLCVLCLILGGVFTLRRGVWFGEDFCYRSGDTLFRKNDRTLIERTSEDTFRVVRDGREETVRCTVSQNRLTFQFSDGDTVSGSWIREFGSFLPDSPDTESAVTAVYSDGSVTMPRHHSEYTAIARILSGNYESISVWFVSLLGVLFYGLGVGCFLEPNKFFFLGGRWRYRGDPELSPEGELSVRFAAALFLCFGVLLTSGLLPAILS